MAKGALHAIGFVALLGASGARAQDVPSPAVSTPATAPADAPSQTPPADVPASPPADASASEPAAEAMEAAPPANPTPTAADEVETAAPAAGSTESEGVGGAHRHHSYGGPAPYNGIKIDGADGLTFYYIRQDLFLGLGATDAARYRAVVASGYYGPNPTGTVIQVRVAAPYLVIPICDGQPLSAHRRIVQSNYGDAITTKVIACH